VNIVEFIGFIISMVAMSIILIKKARDERHRRKNPEQYEKEQEAQGANLKDFLKSLDIDVEDEEQFSPPKPVGLQHIVKEKKQGMTLGSSSKQSSRQLQNNYQDSSHYDNQRFKTSIDNRKFKTSLDDRYKDYGERVTSKMINKDIIKKEEYQVIRRTKTSPAKQILKRLKSTQDMVILHEIIGLPKSLKQDIWTI
jgi:hypothetical protein